MIEFQLSREIEDIESLRTSLLADYSSVKNVVIEQLKIIVIDENSTQQQIDDITQDVTDFINTENIKRIVTSAIIFGEKIMLQFVAENISFGITQAGKTKDVSDYLSNIQRYIQTGSLYEVISEIEFLIDEGLPSDLSPFITESRLNSFKGKITSYLGI